MNAAASENGCCAALAIEGGERFSILTWNIDGLRAFLADAARAAALEELLRARSPLMLCLLEHKLQAQGASSDEARAGLEKLADDLGYDATWTFSPRAGLDGLVVLVRRSTGGDQQLLVAPPTEPRLASDACAHERRLLHVELRDLHVLLVYAPNSGRPGRLAFRTEQWEPSVRDLIRRLLQSSSSSSSKPILLQGDLNVAHVRALDAWGSTLAEFGGGKASGRTPEEAAAFDALLAECGLLDGFRALHPSERSATCWAQKKRGQPLQREFWKRYDYAVVSKQLVATPGGSSGSSGTDVVEATGLRLVDVRHLDGAFDGGRPDHVPVESIFERRGAPPRGRVSTGSGSKQSEVEEM